MKPTTFTDELADFIINGLWEGKTLPELCAERPQLKPRTISDWRKAHPEFRADYDAAMEGGAGQLIDECLPILDDTEEDAQSRRIRVWGRLEIAARKAPLRYGTKIDLNHRGTVKTINRVELVALGIDDDTDNGAADG